MRNRLIYTFLFFSAAFIFIFHYLGTGQAVWGDGIGYFAYLHSWTIDRDWDTTNEYQHLYTPENNNSLSPVSVPQIQIVKQNPDGKADNYFPPGTAILLMPFYLLAHGLTYFANFLGINLPLNGYADMYQMVSGIGAIAYVITGLYFLDKLLISIIKNKQISKLTIILIFLATQLLYYGSFDVINSHFASFFLASAFFYGFYLLKDDYIKNLLLGFLAGFLASTRILDGSILIIWAIDLFSRLLKKDFKGKFNKLLIRVELFILGFMVGILPLAAQTKFLYADVASNTYLVDLAVKIKNIHFADFITVLFNPVNGLFPKAPILFISLIFFFVLIKQNKSGRLWIPAIYLVFEYLVISLQKGWMAAAYGGRMFISLLPFFAILLGLLLNQIRNVISTKALTLLSIGFILFNFFSLGRYVLFEKNTSGKGQGTELITRQRLERMRQFLLH